MARPFDGAIVYPATSIHKSDHTVCECGLVHAEGEVEMFYYSLTEQQQAWVAFWMMMNQGTMYEALARVKKLLAVLNARAAVSAAGLN